MYQLWLLHLLSVDKGENVGLGHHTLQPTICSPSAF